MVQLLTLLLNSFARYLVPSTSKEEKVGIARLFVPWTKAASLSSTVSYEGNQKDLCKKSSHDCLAGGIQLK